MIKMKKLCWMAVFGFSLWACRESGNVAPEAQGEFDYHTTQDVSLTAIFKDNQGGVLTNIPFEVSTSPKFDSTSIISSVTTGSNGSGLLGLNVPSTADTLFVRVKYAGVANRWKVPVGNGAINWNAAQPMNETPVVTTASINTGGRVSAGPYSINYLGSWDSYGRPNYCLPVGDKIGSDLLARINSSLPEAVDLRKTHPEYLTTTDKSVEITQDADVWITFVSEGAGYTSSLLYYTYDKGNPPVTVADLDSVNMIFPNCSFVGSGGGMHSGDKVYLGRFKAGQMIGWLLFSNGYNFGTQKTSLGYWDLHSNQALNSFINPASLRQQNVLLKDPTTGLAILGFEDIRQDNAGCDHDFNDVMFYVSSNPFTAVNTDVLSVMSKPTDTDGDGVTDNLDAYPNDPARAYNQFFPAQNGFNTIAYEDLWPSRGDYDFNDLVIAYNVTQVLNAANKVVDVIMKYNILSVGANNAIGFGVSLPVPTSNLKQAIVVPAYQGTSPVVNGVEPGQSNLTIPFFDDAHLMMGAPAGYFVNTVEGLTYHSPKNGGVTLTFATPVSQAQLGSPPYNSFIFVNDRGVEVHLPNQPPTDKADRTLLGTHADNSVPAKGRYYLTYDNLPWALLIPGTFDYPIEKASIQSAYNNFTPWAHSKGTLYLDWYTNTTGYRNGSLIYAH